MSRVPARGQLSLDEERDELLRTSLLQLISYFSNQMTTAEMMRNQLMVLAHDFMVRPKDIASAADLTNSRVHAVIKDTRESSGNIHTEELVARANQLLRLAQGGHR